MKKEFLYVIILIIGLTLGIIAGIVKSNRYSVAISSGGPIISSFVARIDKITGKVDVAFVTASMEKSEDEMVWFRVVEK